MAHAMNVGAEALVRYDVAGEVVWHKRLLLAQVHQTEWIVVTPDWDLYAEELNPVLNDDVTSVRMLRPGGIIPPGVDPARIYDFANIITDAEKAELYAEGEGLAQAERARRGLPAPVVVPAAVGVAVDPALANGDDGLGAGGLAALNAALGHGAPGGPPPGPIAPVAPAIAPAAVQPHHAGALAMEGRPWPPLGDARSLPVRLDNLGRRHRDLRDCSTLMTEDTFDDWPVRGPRTTLWCLKHMVEQAGNPTAWHAKWKLLAALKDTDETCIAHATACHTLELLARYDQMNIPNLAAAELLSRQIQLIEERRREETLREEAGKKQKHDSMIGAGIDSYLYMGNSASRDGLCICPLLQDWISLELQKESSILKERRKAREERNLQKPAK